MGPKKGLIKELKIFLNNISKEVPVDTAYLFGSRARGNYRKDSDVDLMIVSKKFKGKRWLNRSPQLYSKWNLDYPVDFICLTPGEFNKRKNTISIVSEAIKEGVKII